MIEVGQILDKYELIEKVGQGGMAIVYRGIDHSLKRPVAIKVLHRHLADHQEARDRFEREAHAVAKLRHENILEIFDFSGNESEDAYIVTEFIDGQTLRAFITEHRIQFPVVAAMVCVQICRALAHAHGLGILHRDVKPENIMIRGDGVVKLMDFGIAQMIDLQRMTVTGQLLGSPAYMSPEHVEGRPLDFRTDVFSVGIVLYQLVTGRLPFHGRNPHEILKRIADCKYVDPREVEPRVGKELGGIVQSALARDPDDRYADISEMGRALELYCEGSGLRDYAKELGRYFSAPTPYDMALRERLLSELTRRGTKLMDSDRVGALELFNRVLTIDPDNQPVLAQIERFSRKRRGVRLALLFAGVVLIGCAVVGARHFLGDSGRTKMGISAPAALADAGAADTSLVAPSYDAMVAVALPVADAGVSADGAIPDATPIVQPRPRVKPRPRASGKPRSRSRPDAGAAAAVTPTRHATFIVFPRGSEYKLPGGAWQPVTGTVAHVAIPGSARSVSFRNTKCCQRKSIAIPRVGSLDRIKVTLGFLPGKLTPECDTPGIRVSIDGRRARLGSATVIPSRGTMGRRAVRVVFFSDDSRRLDERTVQIGYKQSKVIRCKF